MSERDLLVNAWNIPEEMLDKLQEINPELTDAVIFSRIKAYAENLGLEVDQVELKEVFPAELKMNLDKLRQILPTIKEYSALKEIATQVYQDIVSWNERDDAKQAIKTQARKLSCVNDIKRLFSMLEKDLQETGLSIDNIERDENGNAKKTIQNYLSIFETIPKMQTVWFDVILNKPVYGTPAKEWKNADDSEILNYIEQTYKLYDENRYQRAFQLFCRSRESNPLVNILDGLAKQWDRRERCENFLIEMAGATVDEPFYVKAISKRIFEAGVNRIYNPGCKCDEMPVLIGAQGSGKSQLIKYLSIHDDYYSQIANIEYYNLAKTLEQIFGHFVVELAEIFGSMKREEQDILKVFMAKQKDVYRTPFDRRPETYPRRFMFIGSTNYKNFLTDPTGNRRFLPIHCNCDKNFIYSKEDKIRDYILSCYGEAAWHYQQGERLRGLAPEVEQYAKKLQSQALVEDWDRGVIEHFVETMKPKYISGVEVPTLVCSKMVWVKALNHDPDEYKAARKKQNEITEILRSMPELLEEIGPAYIEGYGNQLAFRRKF